MSGAGLERHIAECHKCGHCGRHFDRPNGLKRHIDGAHVDGSAIRCLAGDTVVLPEGWSGRWDVIESLKAVRTSVRQS